MQQIAAVCRAQSRLLMVEALAVGGDATVNLMGELFQAGLTPDWWLIEPLPTETAWQSCAGQIAERNPLCHGIIVIARTAEMTPELALGARQELVKGFVAGRALFGPVLSAWLAGHCDDGDARQNLATAYRTLADAWQHLNKGRSI